MVEKVKRKANQICWLVLGLSSMPSSRRGCSLHPLFPTDDDVGHDETQFPSFTANTLSSFSSFPASPLSAAVGEVVRWCPLRCLRMTNQRQNYHFPPNGAVCRRNDRNSQ